MKIRIKEITKKGNIYFRVQVRRFLRWKTMSEVSNLATAKQEVGELKAMDEYNNPKPEHPTLSFIGYGVRNNYGTTGIAYNLSVYENYPTCKRGEYPCKKEDIFWHGGTELITIHTKTLFGDLGLEPHKYRITIEKLD